MTGYRVRSETLRDAADRIGAVASWPAADLDTFATRAELGHDELTAALASAHAALAASLTSLGSGLATASQTLVSSAGEYERLEDAVSDVLRGGTAGR